MQMRWKIETDESYDSDPCPCCGDISRVVSGIIWCDGAQMGRYYVHWALGRVAEFGARFELIVRAWQRDTAHAEYCAVSLLCRPVDNDPGFMVVDSEDSGFAKDDLVTRALNRAQVIGDPLADIVFAMCDAVVAQDTRIAELFDAASSHREPH